MIIEIRKTGFENKGAELMLISALNKLNERYPHAKFVMATGRDVAPFDKRIRYGLLQKSYYWKFGIQFGSLARFLPKKVRETFGVVLDSEVDVVLDASGFSYSEQWGYKKCRELAISSKKWKRNGAKTILLPQAFGPFNSVLTKWYMKRSLEMADLVFTRDRESHESVTNLVGKLEKIKLRPDFTNLQNGILPEWFDSNIHEICIIPNYRMLDKISESEPSLYPSLLKNAIQHLKNKHKKPFFLIHEGESDFYLAQSINNTLEEPIDIVTEIDPLKIKGCIGACEVVISSRFHGLVSALSQGVPCMGTTWSHKYRMLFEDYGYEEGLIDLSVSKEELINKIDNIYENHNIIKRKIENKAKMLKSKSESMWEEVFSSIDK